MDTQKQLCAEAQDHIEAYLDGETSSLASHLESCPKCAAELALARRVREELRALPFLECPPAVTEFPKAPVVPFPGRPEQPGNRQPSPPSQPSRWRFAAAAAAVLLAVLAGVLLLQSPPSPKPDPQFTAAELAQAEEEARLALAYLAEIQQRAGEKIQRDVLVKRVVGPPQKALSRIVEWNTEER